MHPMHKLAAMAALTAAGLLAAATASAQIAVGGGSTLPEPLYGQLLPSGVGLFDFSYSGTGSGEGKQAFFTNNATVFRNESLAARPPWPTSQSVHFVASESVVTATELANYNAVHRPTWGPMIQIPAFATPLLIPYKRSGINNLDLSDAKMCAIFGNKPGGQTWGQVLGTSDPTPVRVVYRLDTDGTTEMLGRYLVASCPGGGFAVSSAFATMVMGATGTIPSHWVGVTGSSGVASAVPSVDGRIGYLSPDPAYTSGTNAVVARINGNLPVIPAIQGFLATQSIPVGGTPAAASNPMNWVPAYVKPLPAAGVGSIYPIFGTSNLLINQCYMNDAIRERIVMFLAGLYSGTLPAPYVTLPYAWQAAITNTFLDVYSPQGIGNVNVCNGIGRPLQN